MSYILVAVAEEEFTTYHLVPEEAQNVSIIDKLNRAAAAQNDALVGEIMDDLEEYRFRFWFGENPFPIITKPVYRMYFLRAYM